MNFISQSSSCCPRLKGAATGLPLPCARVDGLEPLDENVAPRARGQAIFLRAAEPRAVRPGKSRREGNASRPRWVGGVKRMVKYTDIDVRRRRVLAHGYRIVSGQELAARPATSLMPSDDAAQRTSSLAARKPRRSGGGAASQMGG